MAINYQLINSPCFVLDESKLERNLAVLENVQDQAGVDIILALKGFAMWSTFPLIASYLKGATASSINEAQLCMDKMGTRAHTYCVAYKQSEFERICALSSHIIFNSLSQYHAYKSQLKKVRHRISVGLRVNPEYADVTTELYNPASPTSRLGITSRYLEDGVPDGVEGIHFHVLCESSSHALETVLMSLEKKFAKCLKQVNWVNMGGGHLITGEDYDIDHLINLLRNFKKKHGVRIILEPGSAVAWQAGDLVARIIDIVENGGVKSAIVDVSFTCHMPDCLEMPYKPAILGARKCKVEGYYPYHIGGLSCLAGDFIGEYWFGHKLQIGEQLIFEDMIHYTMVKTSTFNGIDHPSIGIWRKNNTFEIIRKFDYEDYKSRLS